MIQQSYNGRDVNTSFPYGKRSATTLQKSELSKHYRCLHLLKSFEVGNGDKFPDFADLLFFFGIKNVRVGWSIRNTHIFLFGLSNMDILTVAILTLSDKRLIETDLLKTGFLF
jgi:hypothetical protein